MPLVLSALFWLAVVGLWKVAVPLAIVAAVIAVVALVAGFIGLLSTSSSERSTSQPLASEERAVVPTRRQASAAARTQAARIPASTGPRRSDDAGSDTPRSALVIDEPWISEILAGRKTWEMRSRRVNKRERVALVRKGSGQIVAIANLIDCLGPLTDEELAGNAHRHRVPLDQIGTWRFAWVLAGVRPLSSPVPYSHTPGAQNWVTLDDATRETLSRR